MITWSEAAEQHVALVKRFDPVVSSLADWTNGTVNGGPNGDGTYPFTQADGTVFFLPCPAKLQAFDGPGEVYPDEFDRLAGTGGGHDDLPAFQAMIASAYLTGRKPCGRSNAVYHLSDTIQFDPSRIGFEGNGCSILGDLKTYYDPKTMPGLIDNPTFVSNGAGWLNGNAANFPVTFDGSGMTFAPPSGENDTRPTAYTEIGRQISAKRGTVVEVTLEVTALTSRQDFTLINTFRSMIVSLRTNTVGRTPGQNISSGPNAAGGISKTISNADADYEPGYTVTAQFTLSSDDPWLRIQSNASFVIKSAQIRVVPMNAVILIRTPPASEGGLQRGHTYREFCNFKVGGRAGAQAAFADGIFFDTPVVNFSSRAMCRNLEVNGNLNRGMIFANRTYLNVFINCRSVATSCSLYTTPGSADAGENISFFGGNMGGGLIGIFNEGSFNINCYGMSIDFSRQFYVGRGLFTFDGWLEMNESSLVVGYPIIDVWSGEAHLRTKIQGDGAVRTVLATPFRVAKNALLNIEGTQLYGWLGTTGALCEGEGRFYLRTTGIPDKQISPIGKRDDTHNTLGNSGSFEPLRSVPGKAADNSRTPAMLTWAYSQGQEQLERNLVGFRGMATMLGDVTQGERAVVNTSVVPLAAILQAEVVNQEVIPGSRIAKVFNSGSFGGNTAVGSRTITGVSPVPNANLALNKFISADNLAPGSEITGYSNGGATIELSKPAIAAGPGTFSTSRIIVLSQPYNGPTALQQPIHYRPTGITGSGTIAGSASRGSDAISGVAPGEYTATGIVISDPAYPRNTVVRWYDAVAQVLYLTNRRVGASLVAGTVAYQKVARAGCVITGEAARTGAQCLKLFKRGIGTQAMQCFMAIPLRPNRTFGGEMYFKIPANPAFAPGTTAAAYMTGWFVQIAQFGEEAVPTLGQMAYISDQPQTGLDLNAGQDWTRLTFATTRYDQTSSHDGYSPEWATHFLIMMDLSAVPDGFSMLVDDLFGSIL